ncbi:MAG: hypothetical protein KDI75_10035, partial [Xanthomonadales bacterium]|nr:hypothetical protein [Xanthomonadales bacterium]
TLTFRPDRCGRTGGMHPEAADKAFRFWVSSVNRDLYGRTWGKRWHRGLMWARGQEFHKDGRIHFHAVISSASDDLYRLGRWSDWHALWLREFGVNKLERPESQSDIAGYVSKYVAKGGEVDFSPNFQAWQPPPMQWGRAPQQEVFLATSQNAGACGQVASPARVVNGSGAAAALSLS